MQDKRRILYGPLIVQVIAVCLFGTLVGSFFGFLAIIPYSLEFAPPGQEAHNLGGNVTIVLIVGNGFLASIIWCWIMIPKSISLH